MNVNYILKKPIITEKSLTATKDNCYTFEVVAGATKDQIKAALKSAFQVDVISIRTSIKKPVQTSTGKRRLPSKTNKTKKAVVCLKAGQTIKVFEVKG